MANATNANAGAGGGLISGNGTFYSQPTQIDKKYYLSDQIALTGTIAGTLTIQISNDGEEQDRNGTAQWQTYDRVNLGGFVAGVATLVAGAIVGGTNPGGWEAQRPVSWGRIRLQLIVTGGTGTIRNVRTSKGA